MSAARDLYAKHLMGSRAEAYVQLTPRSPQPYPPPLPPPYPPTLPPPTGTSN